MFIEGLRRAKNKWRIVVGILMGLIIISLLLTFANFGSKVDTSGINTGTSALTTAETTAKNAASAAKGSADDMTVQGDAAKAYLNLGAYQDLYLEDATGSYKKALTYANAMVAACGNTQEPDYDTAYGYVISAYSGLKDAAGLSATFNESLTKIELSDTYISTYATAMMDLDANEQLITDLTAAREIAETTAAPTTEEDAAMGPQDLVASIDNYISQAQAELDPPTAE